jgi:8-oxo-dGTP pyrophosphatase MutT (NUDIX family)
MTKLDELDINALIRCLSRKPAATYDDPALWGADECQEAAVLLPMFRQQQAWHLLFIRRAQRNQDYHSGQVAFAGGKREDADASLLDTALREAHEEIGLHPQDVQILGELGAHFSASRFRITPVVGYIPWPYRLTLQMSEVDRVFSIPLDWLAQPDSHRTKQHSINGKSIPVAYFNEYDGEVLWGATARMTLSLINCLSSG